MHDRSSVSAFHCKVLFICSFKDKEVQKDAKMVPYKIIDKSSKPYVEVKVGGESKVIFIAFAY